MKRCICNTEPTVTCAGMKYYVSCPKCGLATDMYDTLEDAEKAWDSRRVEMGKYVLKVVEEKKAIEKKKEVVPKEDKVVPKEEPKEELKEEKVVPKEEPKENKVVPKEDKVVPAKAPDEEPRPYKKRTRKEK